GAAGHRVTVWRVTSPAPSRLQEARPWEAGPSRPHLRDRGLEVWRADLRATSDATLRWLASDERARAARFPVAARGRLWAHARGVLRALLGAYLEEVPRA